MSDSSTICGRPRGLRIFDDANRLRLLQLTARRAIAERKQDTADGEQITMQLETQSMPSSWQLIPEGLHLHNWQRECLPLWLNQGRGTVKVATGGGKTLFALAAAQALQNATEPDLRLVVVVPTIPLMLQWHDEIANGNLPASAVGMLGGSQREPESDDLRVLICVINSARDKLPQFVQRFGWSAKMMLVVDECHRANAEQSRRIFESNPRYTLGLSATPEQADDGELAPDVAYEASPVGQGLGPIIYDFTLAQSLAAGLLTPFEIWHIGVSLSGDEAAQHAQMSREISELRKSLQSRHRRSRSRQGFLAWCQTQASRGGSAAEEATRFVGLANARKRLLYHAHERADATLALLADAMEDRAARAIVFHESIEEVEDIFRRADERSLPVVVENSKLPDVLRAESIDAFRKGIARAIISARSLIEGFNVPSADVGIIAASSGAVRQRIQSLGRMLRRKEEDRTARIYVLYVAETEDEAIYEKADWENVIGAGRNRYFRLRPGEEHFNERLVESPPPRVYRPPCGEIDVEVLISGAEYPARADGIDLRLDQERNVRTEDGDLVPVTRGVADAIVEMNGQGRARLTPCGHVIARSDRGERATEWCYVGVAGKVEQAAEEVVRFQIKQRSGRRVISKRAERGRELFALGPEKGSSIAGAARDALLEWTAEIAAGRMVSVKTICWDGKRSYWVELDGQRIDYPSELAPLEFAG